LQRENIVHSSRRARQTALSSTDDDQHHLGALALGASHKWFRDEEPAMSSGVSRDLVTALTDPDIEKRILAALVCTHLGTLYKGNRRRGVGLMPVEPDFRRLVLPLATLLESDDWRCVRAACAALAVLWRAPRLRRTAASAGRGCSIPMVAPLESDARAVYPTWALAVQPLLARDAFAPAVWGRLQ